MRYDDPQRPSREGVRLQTNGEPLPVVTLIAPSGEGPGWLACIHASRGGNRFGYHSGVLADLGAFAREYLQDPEAALARYFQYEGPEELPQPARRTTVAIGDLWED